MKIDILEAYIWISEVFRVKSGFYRSTGKVSGTPRESIGPMGLRGKERGAASMGRAPLPPLVRIGLGGGGAPPFPSPSPPSFPLLVVLGKGGSNSYLE